MSAGPIARLSETDLQFVPEPPEFEALAAAELGQHGTDADGFPALFNEAADLTVAGSHAFDGSDQDLADASNASAALAQPEGAQLAAEIEPAAAAADAMLNEFAGGVGVTPIPPTPEPPPPAPAPDCPRTLDFGELPNDGQNYQLEITVPPSLGADLTEGATDPWAGIEAWSIWYSRPTSDQDPSGEIYIVQYQSLLPGTHEATFTIRLANAGGTCTIHATASTRS